MTKESTDAFQSGGLFRSWLCIYRTEITLLNAISNICSLVKGPMVILSFMIHVIELIVLVQIRHLDVLKLILES